MPDDVLDLIDGTLRDYETSADAMRWTPDPDARDRADKQGEVTVTITSDLSGFYAAMAEVTAGLIRTFGEMLVSPWVKSVKRLAEQLAHDIDARERPRWHVRRCTTCNPGCALTPPCPGGREYSRRRKARARRNRRR